MQLNSGIEHTFNTMQLFHNETQKLENSPLSYHNSIWVCVDLFLSTRGNEMLRKKLLYEQEIVAILLELGRVATFAGERNHISSKVVSTIDQ